ncbi:very short patch repair endonuclease [Pollutimonas bauzanensis]|uniref:very short patch repair endonuclease n=1 Tax=Pollutimonas bauzanensis TaxID=658167 RepID=UPI00333F1CBC
MHKQGTELADKVSPEIRSRIMAAIRSKDTKPEMVVRRGLFARGFRYRLHKSHMPGKPDLVFPKFGAVVFVHGCFWHGHEGCRLYRPPLSRQDYWNSKIERNQIRADAAEAKLREQGWRVSIVWECSFRGKAPEEQALKLDQLASWLRLGA